LSGPFRTKYEKISPAKPGAGIPFSLREQRNIVYSPACTVAIVQFYFDIILFGTTGDNPTFLVVIQMLNPPGLASRNGLTYINKLLFSIIALLSVFSSSSLTNRSGV